MSFGISIKVTDGATPTVRAVARATSPAALNPVIGRAATNTVRSHLLGLNRSRPNQLGGRRTNFYATAGRATNFTAVAGGVLVSISHVGIAQRYYGGRIVPRRTKYLTVPAAPEAHGKRAGEFPNLKFAIIPGKGPALVLMSATKVTAKRVKRTGRLGEKLTDGVVFTTSGGELKPIFWLRRSVNQKADPTVLPADQVLYDEVEKAVVAVVDRAIARSQGGPS